MIFNYTIIQEAFLNSDLIQKTITEQDINLQQLVFFSEKKNEPFWLQNYKFIGILHKLKTTPIPIKDYKFYPLINYDLQKYNNLKIKKQFINFLDNLKKLNELKFLNNKSLYKYQIQNLKKSNNTKFIKINNQLCNVAQTLEANSNANNAKLIKLEKNNIVTIFEKEKLIISNSNNPIGNSSNLNNLSSLNISSSSHEDNEAIIRRLNNSFNFSNLSSLNISSSSHENNEAIMRRLNNDLINFIDNNELSFYHPNNNENGFIKFKILNLFIKDSIPLNTRIYYEVKNKPYFITKVTYLIKLNIKIENGRNFFLNNEISNNLLIKYLQSIEKNNEEGLKFCLNILKLYNHKDYKKFAIYSNLYNTDVAPVYKKSPDFLNICYYKLYSYKAIDNFIGKDLKNFSMYLFKKNFKEANNLLMKYNDNKKVNKLFLKIMIISEVKEHIKDIRK